MNPAFMDYLATIFVPTGNRRLNELIGFLMCVSALLLFLALVSYSPLDPSWNSASVLTGSHAARNWIGIVGAYTADAVLQFFGVGAFLLIIFPAMLGDALVPLDESAVSAGQEPGRNLAADVRSGDARAAARTAALDARDSDRRPAGPRDRRFPDSLPESGWRVHRLRHRSWRSRFISRRRSRSRRFRFGLRRALPSSPRCGIATKIGRRSAPRKRQQKELEQRRISKPIVKTQLIPVAS